MAPNTIDVPFIEGLAWRPEMSTALSFLTRASHAIEGDLVGLECDFDRSRLSTTSRSFLILKNGRLIPVSLLELAPSMQAQAAIAYTLLQEDRVIPTYIDLSLAKEDNRNLRGSVTKAGIIVRSHGINQGVVGMTDHSLAQSTCDKLGFTAFPNSPVSQHDALQKHKDLDWLVADQVNFGEIARHMTLADAQIPDMLNVCLIPAPASA